MILTAKTTSFLHATVQFQCSLRNAKRIAKECLWSMVLFVLAIYLPIFASTPQHSAMVCYKLCLHYKPVSCLKISIAKSYAIKSVMRALCKFKLEYPEPLDDTWINNANFICIVPFEWKKKKKIVPSAGVIWFCLKVKWHVNKYVNIQWKRALTVWRYISCNQNSKFNRMVTKIDVKHNLVTKF